MMSFLPPLDGSVLLVSGMDITGVRGYFGPTLSSVLFNTAQSHASSLIQKILPENKQKLSGN